MSTSQIAYLRENQRIIGKAVKEHLSNLLIERYLDLGCGNCFLTQNIASIVRANEVICVDTNDEALSITRKLGYKSMKVDLNYGLPIPNNSVDLVTVFELIEHV